ncbi:hypothetical protein H9Q09_01180 [Aurantimonas sp. DM33-3]|uniref:hypothetical protein n=1 Tax=Aurantimonas sp. DM33-3 TaxID=2766955 RepID=UPI001651B31F|nr:hypothetical protein [Aurantimonas sp. DM33-3]MBC6714798.1 hypothetical protein [Aurantimonas sp. DM33-3]
MSLPSPDNDYKAPADMRLGRVEWDAAFVSVGERLRILEGWEVNYQTTVDQLKAQALDAVVATLTQEIDARRADLIELQGEFQAVSDAYTELVSGGVYADGIQLRNAVVGLTATTVQGSIEELAVKVSSRRRITGDALFFGAM